MDRNESAIIFFGVVQPDKNDQQWNHAAAQYEKEILERPPLSSYSGITMGSLTPDINFISVTSSDERVESDETSIELDLPYLMQQPTAQWSEMLENWCSQYGIQLYDQKPAWHLALQENGPLDTSHIFVSKPETQETKELGDRLRRKYQAHD